ncbi:hypothetical protein [Prevotella koreensis]
MTTPLQAMNTFSTISTTNRYNTQCKEFVSNLRELTQRYNVKVKQVIALNPTYTGSRSNGVKLAWKYEKADITMGGKGSANWNELQRQEIKERGTVRGAEGHHQRNVADYPEEQVNPDNIKFYKSKKEHLEKGHNGDFHNESVAPKIDKEDMLKRTNRKRVLKNELKGASLAAIIGFVSGASIGFIVTIAQNGISPDSIKDAAINGWKVGLEGAAFGLLNHMGTRFVGDIATNTMTVLLSNFGIKVTENITKSCNMAVAGSVAIITFSIYQFVRLKRNGLHTNEALRFVWKDVKVSVASLAITVTVQAAFGGPAALAVSIGIGAILLSYSMYNVYHDKKLMSKIHCYTIEKSYPLILE